MLERTISRHNELIDPAVHVWGWEIPVYLFVGGLVAGMMIIAGYLLLSGRYRNQQSVIRTLPALSLIVLSLGMLALFLDLEHKLYFWRLYTTFQIASPMSWGAWILLLVYPALILTLFVRLPALLTERWPLLQSFGTAVFRDARVLRWIGLTNVVLGTLLGVYTGILLSAMGARPLWNSALLGPLFLTSGLSGAAALVHMLSTDSDEQLVLTKADNTFLFAEMLLIVLLLIGLTTSSDAHVRAAALFLGGPYTGVFWILVVGAGILFPLVLQVLALRHRIKHTLVAPLLVVVGGLVLRFVIVFAGQASHL